MKITTGPFLRTLLMLGFTLAIVVGGWHILSDSSHQDRLPQTELGPAMPAPQQKELGAKLSPKVRHVPRQCRNQAAEAFVPVRVTLRGIASAPVLALGLDENNAPAAPPFDQPNTFSWYKLGPAPASTAGNVLLLAHTFSSKPVIGNLLLERLSPDALIVLRGSKGQIACYRVSKKPITLRPAQYPSYAYRFDGSPRLLITVCSSYNSATKVWEQRTVWTATAVK